LYIFFLTDSRATFGSYLASIAKGASMKFTFIFFLILAQSLRLYSQVGTSIGFKSETIFPLEVSSSNFYNDLLPLKDLLGSKNIVGMGEATHGTKEFFQLKAEVFKFLVLHCNYKVFAIEDSFGSCGYINDYVLSGTGDVDSAMLHFNFWTWRTQEVRELILWIRNYNLLKPDFEKVSFYGFDMQNSFSPIQYLDNVFKSDTTRIAKDLKGISMPILSGSDITLYKKLINKESKFQDTLQLVYHQLQTWLVSNESYLKQTYSKHQYENLNFCIQNFNQSNSSLKARNISSYRDSCMGFNVMQIKKIENKKMFIWAHNGHINLSYPDKVSSLMGLPMGGHIKNSLKEQYYAIGFVFNEGSFQAIKGPNSITDAIFKYIFRRKKLYKGLQECTVPVNSKNTFTNALSHTGHESYFINLNTSENTLFKTTQKTYDVGAVFLNYRHSSDDIEAKKQFDGLIYVHKTNRAIPIKLP
jgi:erythromycin esterase